MLVLLVIVDKEVKQFMIGSPTYINILVQYFNTISG